MRRVSLSSGAIGAGVVLVAVAVVLAFVVTAAARPHVRISSASRPLVLEGSNDGQALLRAGSLAPGDTVSGAIGVTNAGSGSGRLVVRAGDVTDRPGAGGGRLSTVLRLRVAEGDDVRYAGPLAGMGTVDLGDLRPGATRHVQFRATFVEHGAPRDNRFQAAETTVPYRFAATLESEVRGAHAQGTRHVHDSAASPGSGTTPGPGVLGTSVTFDGSGGRGALPFTGLPALLVGLTGLALIGLGVLLRRRTA